MVLVDTSVWIDHLRKAEPGLVSLLEGDQVFGHPWVVGELALGTIRDRSGFLEMLGLLPAVEVAADRNVRALIEEHRLFNRGIGWVDAQLLAACIAYPCRLWTKHRRLAEIAVTLAVGWQFEG